MEFGNFWNLVTSTPIKVNRLLFLMICGDGSKFSTGLWLRPKAQEGMLRVTISFFLTFNYLSFCLSV